VIAILNTQINTALADPVLKSRLAELGAATLLGSPSEFGQLLAQETAKWAEVIKFAGIKAD
jgi:tripartite-type tricarboxylate transporter receptor subunit TctC